MALTPGQSAQATASALRFIVLVDLIFPAGAVYVTDLDRAITVGGTAYSPASVLQGITGAEDNIDGKARRLSVRLAALDAGIRTRTLANRIAFGSCLVRLAFCDPAWNILDTPVVLSRAALSNSSATYDEGSGTLEISAESSLILLRRNARQVASHQSQLLRFPGDTSMSRVSNIGSKKISWGGRVMFTEEQRRQNRTNQTASNVSIRSGGSDG